MRVDQSRYFAFLLCAVMFLAACNTRIRGQIIDAETRQPITGAVVLIGRGVGCFGLRGFEMINPMEVLTDFLGRFDADYSQDAKHRCWSRGAFISHVGIIAAGYMMEFLDAGNPPRQIRDFDKGPVGLTRIKYQVEYERYARRLKDREWDWVNPENAPLWRAALDKLRAAPVRKAGEPGVFVSQPGSRFDQISLIDLRFENATWKSSAVLAHDRNTGLIHGWNFNGTKIVLPIPPEPGLSLVGYHSRMRYPFIARNDRLLFPANFDSSPTLDRFDSKKWSSIQSQSGIIHFASSYSHLGLVATVEGPNRQLGVYKIEETINGDLSMATSVNRNSYRLLFPKGRPSIECMASGPEQDSLVIVANTSNGRLFLYLPAWGDLGEGEPQVKRFDVPNAVSSTEVTACTASEEKWQKYFYVALRDQGIRKFEVPAAYPGTDKRPRAEAPFGGNNKDSILGTASGPKTFTSLIVSERDKEWYAVYGVAADQNVYRFTADGVPEQRVEIDLAR